MHPASSSEGINSLKQEIPGEEAQGNTEEG